MNVVALIESAPFEAMLFLYAKSFLSLLLAWLFRLFNSYTLAANHN